MQGQRGRIVGSGMIARAFAISALPGTVYFASGVSNSKSRALTEFDRERKLLEGELSNSRDCDNFVYFSTCSIWDESKLCDPYVHHKLKMEQLILSDSRGVVLRLPSVVGHHGNPNTLVANLARSINERQTLNLESKSSRYLLHTTDMVRISNSVLGEPFDRRKPLAIAPKFAISIVDIVENLGALMKVEPIISLVDVGHSFEIPNSFLKEAFDAAQRIGSKIETRGYPKSVLETYLASLTTP
jgi:hypothetical protein